MASRPHYKPFARIEPLEDEDVGLEVADLVKSVSTPIVTPTTPTLTTTTQVLCLKLSTDATIAANGPLYFDTCLTRGNITIDETANTFTLTEAGVYNIMFFSTVKSYRELPLGVMSLNSTQFSPALTEFLKHELNTPQIMYVRVVEITCPTIVKLSFSTTQTLTLGAGTSLIVNRV